MNICGYLRVSGKGQLAGDGFDRQRETIERYAADNAWTVTRWFEERGRTGKSEWDDRDAWVEMVATQPDIIIVENMSRLAREFAVQEIFWRQLRKINVRLLSASEPDLEDDEADHTRKLIRGILGLLHEYDRSQIESKLRAARTRIRAREGRCEGRKPYGGHPDRPEEVRSLEQMVQLSRAGFTTREIASQLNASNVPTRRGKGPWRHGTVAKIISANGFGSGAPGSANLPGAPDALQFAMFAPAERSSSEPPEE